MKDDQPQTGDKADKSQPDEIQPIEETAQVEESEEQCHDQIKGSQNEDQEPGNDQTEADDQNQQLQDQINNIRIKILKQRKKKAKNQ